MYNVESNKKRMLGKNNNTTNSTEAFMHACQCFCDCGQSCYWDPSRDSAMGGDTQARFANSYGSSSGMATWN